MYVGSRLQPWVKQPILFHAPTKDLNNNTITEMIETYKNSMRGCNQNQNRFTYNAMQNTMQFDDG